MPSWLLLAMIAVLVVNILEMVLYVGFAGVYYRAGPPLFRRVWATRVSRPVADETLSRVLADSALAWRLRGRGDAAIFAARKRFSRFSMWPRFTVTVRNEPGSDTVTITCESRPFVSLLLFLPPVLLAPANALFPATIFVNAMIAGSVLVSYAGFWAWERNPKELDRLRQALAPIGVSICPHCGYDLRASPTRCPECGTLVGSGHSPRTG